MKTKLFALLLVAGTIFFSACSDDEIDTSDVKLQFNMPESLKAKNVSLNETKATILLTNKNSGVEKTKELLSFDKGIINVEDGIYDVFLTGDVDYTIEKTYVVKTTVKENGKKVLKEETKTELINSKSKIRGIQQNVSVVGGQLDLAMDLFLFKESTGFVISEVFFRKTQTLDEKDNLRDQFIEIYNNSDQTLYADGLCIGETEFHCNWVRTNSELTPNLISTHTAFDGIYCIPGSGKEHPVLPGKTIILCDIAKNHKTDNPKSFDLSGADFEWYDDDSQDIDVAEVPNLEKIYSASATIFGFHSEGKKSFVLFRLDKKKEDFIEENVYKYKYFFEFGSFSTWMGVDEDGNPTKKAYHIPNTSIVDAVGCATPSSYLWNVLDPSLDLSWTHSGDSDKASYGHSVKRKVSYKEADGRIVLMDTNNSALDFIPTAIPTPGSPE